MPRVRPRHVVIAAAVLVALVSTLVVVDLRHPTTEGSASSRILGPTASGLPWHSGAWVGGRFSSAGIDAFGSWRGRPADLVTTYVEPSSYAAMVSNVWSIETWKGFQGRLSYGLRLLPEDGAGSLTSIGNGDQDQVWAGVAGNLVRLGRGDAVVRVGWEANLPDWRHHATAATAAEYKRAFQRVHDVMHAVGPDLKFEFGVGCGAGLEGSHDRLAPLTELYPGDAYVDLVGCDTYDWYHTHADSDATWRNVLSPAGGPGIQDVVDFAREHYKGATFSEWGLSARRDGNNGGGDNRYYIESMYDFFATNADVVAAESYFDEPSSYLASSLFPIDQNPRAAAVYAERW